MTATMRPDPLTADRLIAERDMELGRADRAVRRAETALADKVAERDALQAYWHRRLG